MHALNSQADWHNHTKFQHWAKHSFLPVALIAAILWLPKPWTLAIFQPNSVIEIELIETQTTISETPTTEPVPIAQPVLKPVIEQPIETPSEKTPQVIEQAPKEPTQLQTESKPQEVITVKPTTKISAGDVIKMMQNRKSIEVPVEFQATTQPASDFYIPEPEIHDWFADLPYLDESVDKPKLQMKFYAEGLDGSIEKFFDKITISKTFTTKYGTKIHCALIGVIAACGWK